MIPFLKPTTPLDRQRLGKYELICRLSAGGMSEIFLAAQKGIAGFQKIVVLKSVLPDIRGEENFVRMFLEEARITSSFDHPNIAQVFDLDTDDGTLFLAMEFVQGATVSELTRACQERGEPIPLGFTLAAVRDTALALHYAHSFCDARGRPLIVIHRDVSGKNIMVTYEGTAKLLDFGIAKSLGRSGGNHTLIGTVKGTSGYMSPEQARGEPLDPRTDVFSLGVVLHEGLTGKRLFSRETPIEEMRAVQEAAEPPSRTNPAISPALDRVALKALSLKREQRFASALEFARAIEAAAPGELWHPEETGELVKRLYADRLSQTQRLAKSAQGATGEHSGIRVYELSTDLSPALRVSDTATTEHVMHVKRNEETTSPQLNPSVLMLRTPPKPPPPPDPSGVVTLSNRPPVQPLGGGVPAYRPGEDQPDTGPRPLAKVTVEHPVYADLTLEEVTSRAMPAETLDPEPSTTISLPPRRRSGKVALSLGLVGAVFAAGILYGVYGTTPAPPAPVVVVAPPPAPIEAPPPAAAVVEPPAVAPVAALPAVEEPAPPPPKAKPVKKKKAGKKRTTR